MLQLHLLNEQIPDIELLAKQVVDGFIIGLHKSPFHGFSVEFAEHRLYNPGDNLRHVDWKVYGRNDKMFTKKYEEETNLRCCVALDTSASMFFKSEHQKINKIQASIIGAASIIELLKRQMDACSLALFDEQIHTLTKAGTSGAHRNILLSQLQLLWNTRNHGKNNSHIVGALHELAERLHQRSMVVLFSDLMDQAEDPQALIDALQHLRHNKHEVIIFMVGERDMEWNFNFPDRPLELKDMETGDTIQLHPSSIQDSYNSSMEAYIQLLKEQCASMKVDFHLYDSSSEPSEILRNYLMKRKKLM